MALDGINGIQVNSKVSNNVKFEEKANKFKPLLNFSNSVPDTKEDVSDAKIITENFKNDIIDKLDAPKSERASKNSKFYLDKLITVAQMLNGLQKNNLKPQGNSEQNRVFNSRIQEKIQQMNNYAEFVGRGLSVVQDSKTGLYKLCVNDKLYDIPQRQVEIRTVHTEAGDEFTPVIVDE